MIMKKGARIGAFDMRPTIIFFGFITAAAFLLSGCATPSGGNISVDWEKPKSQQESPQPKVAKKTGPPSHAPAHGYRAKHSYRYYPNERIYYDVERTVYFYLEKDGWTIGASLPNQTRLSSDYVTVKLETDRPYDHYDEHAKKYPPQKGKKKEKKKDKKWAKKIS